MTALAWFCLGVVAAGIPGLWAMGRLLNEWGEALDAGSEALDGWGAALDREDALRVALDALTRGEVDG